MELEELKKKYPRRNVEEYIKYTIGMSTDWNIVDLISELEYIRDNSFIEGSETIVNGLEEEDTTLSFYRKRLETDVEYINRLKKEQERLAKLIETEKSEFEKAKKTYLRLKEKYEN